MLLRRTDTGAKLAYSVFQNVITDALYGLHQALYGHQ
jgi:hypothetical protein